MDNVKFVLAASLALSLFVLAVKYLAFWLTGSVALYSDAVESLVNVATAVGGRPLRGAPARPRPSLWPRQGRIEVAHRRRRPPKPLGSTIAAR